MRSLFLGILVFLNHLSVLAGPGDREINFHDPINVEGARGNQGPRGEPGGNAGGRGGDLGSRNDPSAPPVNSPKPVAVAPPQASAQTLQKLSDVYSTYSSLQGYSYSRTGNNTSIFASFPIEVFEEHLKDSETGFGYTENQAISGAIGVLSQEESATTKEFAVRLENLQRKDLEKKRENEQKSAALETNFGKGSEEQRQVIAAEFKIDNDFQQFSFRGSPRIQNLEQLDSAYFYAKAHIGLAKKVLNPMTRTNKALGPQYASEVAQELLKVAFSTTEFIGGLRNGAEGAVIETINGVVTVSRFTFSAVRNPVQAYNQVLSVMEGINAQIVGDLISGAIDGAYDVMLNGSPYEKGSFLGLVATNLMTGFLPINMAPIMGRLASSLAGSRIASITSNVYSSLGHLGRGGAGRIFNIFSRLGGVQGGKLISIARASGLKTQEQFEQFGIFLNKILQNQIGGIGEIESIGNEAVDFFKVTGGGKVVNSVFDITSSPRSSFQGQMLQAQLAAEEIAGVKLPTQITGFTRHGLNNAISREGVGVSNVAIKDALDSPLSIEGKTNGTFRIEGKDAVIVLNVEGKVVTTWPISINGRRFKLSENL